MKTIILQHPDIYRGDLILVNAQHAFSDQNIASAMTPLYDSPCVRLAAVVVNQLSGLLDEINGWDEIQAVSGWRSYQEQSVLYSKSLSENGASFTNKYVALSGHSEHHSGLAVDLSFLLKGSAADKICPDFPSHGICQLFRERAATYGFIERYPQGKESITGIAHEPWHFRYVGSPHAEIMHMQGLVLEEYLQFLKQFRYGTNPFSYEEKNSLTEISYLEASNKNTELEVDTHISCFISGNNMDGFIITQWRKKA